VLLQQIINGITIGSMYAMVAIGYSMVFSVLELVNLANGSMFMIGAYFAVFFLSVFAVGGAQFASGGMIVLALLIALVLSGVLGLLLERFSLRGLRRRGAPKLASLISSLGMSIAIDNAVLLLFGGASKPFPRLFNWGSIHIGNAIVQSTQIVILVVGAVLMTALSIVVYKTKIGKAMLATAQNNEVSKLMGININMIIAITFVISGVLACVSGILYGSYYASLDTGIGSDFSIKVFASAILGGIGSLPGAVVGGLVIGVIETIVAGYISVGYRNTIAFVILVVMLLFRPQGLFGQKQINKV